MKKWLPVFIIFLLTLGGIWFWSLGALPQLTEERVTLTSSSGDVTVKHPDKESFADAEDNLVLENGSIIKTGSQSKATIDFYGKAEVSLDEHTELVIQESALKEETGSPLVSLRLEAGRIWSRVISILDLEGEFKAETSDVVATVRGTSFDLAIENDRTTLWVADSVVETNGATAAFVPEGQMLRFTNGRRDGDMMPISEEAKSLNWFTENRERDAHFHEAARGRLLRRAGGRQLPAPGIFRDIVRGSEAMRTSFSEGEQRQALVSRYLLRRFAFIRQLVADGEYGSAQREFTRAKHDMNQLRDQSELERRAVRKALHDAVILFHDIDPKSEAYSLKQQLEELLIIAAPDASQAMMLRLMSVQSRMDEAGRAFRTNQYDSAGKILELAKQSHANVAREMQHMEGEERALTKLEHVMHAIEVRMTHFEALLEEERRMAPLRDIERQFERDGNTATSTQLTEQTCRELLVTATPSQFEIGGKSYLEVRVVTDENQTRTVTDESLITLSGTAASLSGAVITGVTPGSAALQASYDCNGRVLRGQTSIQVVESVLPQGITISPSVVRMNILEEATLRVDALYSNGEKKNVTADAVFTNLTPEFGFMAGSQFIAGQLPGDARIEVQYSEGSETFAAEVLITVQALQ